MDKIKKIVFDKSNEIHIISIYFEDGVRQGGVIYFKENKWNYNFIGTNLNRCSEEDVLNHHTVRLKLVFSKTTQSENAENIIKTLTNE